MSSKEENQYDKGNLVEITEVMRGVTKMKGVVARRDIKKKNQILCTYVGDKMERKERCIFLHSIEKEHGRKERNRHSAYDMDYPLDEDYLYVPVDHEGKIKTEYAKAPALYINEASEIGEYPNAEFRDRGEYIDVVNIKPIKKGQEILVYYGISYERDWGIWWKEDLKFLRKSKTDRKRRESEAMLEDLLEKQKKLQKQQEEVLERQKVMQNIQTQVLARVLGTASKGPSRKIVPSKTIPKVRKPTEIIDLTQ